MIYKFINIHQQETEGRMKPILNSFLLLLCFAITSTLFAQQDSNKPKPYSVLIMPFYDDLNYPYGNDQIREGLIRAFYRRDYDVVLDDSTWSILLDLDYRLANILPVDADSISNFLDVDLIVFGQISNTYKYRSTLSTAYTISNPILVWVFDAKKKEVVLRERLSFTERWGLIEKNYNVYDLGDVVVDKLIVIGYKTK